MAGNVGGAFTGLYQGASGAADASAALKPLLPNISVYQQGPSSAPALQAQVTTPASSYDGGGGNLAKFGHFLGGLGSETGHLVEGAASWLAHNVVNMAEAPYKLGEGLAKGGLGSSYFGVGDHANLAQIQAQGNQLTGRLQSLNAQWKSGAINSKQYQTALKALNQDGTNLDKQSTAMTNKVTLDQKSTNQALIDTASDLIVILTTGFGKAATTSINVGKSGIVLNPMEAKTAADWLASKVAAPMLEPASATISRLAVDSRAFQALDNITQNVLQRATAEVVASAGEKMTATQIARATAANVALKYPIYFNYMSSTASQVYQELDQAKYGDAVRTLAFNAGLLLSGGPIGHALDYAKRLGIGISERTFGQTSFWDELSKFYGGDYAKTISSMAQAIEDPKLRATFIKNLSAVEATNLHAMGGDAVAAAFRLAKGEAAKAPGGMEDLAKMSPEEAINEMVNLAHNFRIANDAAQKAGVGQIAVGRFDARSKGAIADAVTSADNVAGRLKAWEDLKAERPNDALANNTNLDREVKAAIASKEDPVELRKYIMNINAQKTLEGLPKDVVEKMAKNGYVPIKPRSLEAPFREGSDKLLTANGSGEDFFMKAVQPLPVLGSVGRLFTGMGLSPNTSTQRVYQMFTDNVARNMGLTQAALKVEEQRGLEQAVKDAKAAETKAPKGKEVVAEAGANGLTKEELAFAKKNGITPETHPEFFNKAAVIGEQQGGATVAKAEVAPVAEKPSDKYMSTTDYMLKKLSDYAHNLKVPVGDMRMLTNKHIREALKVSYQEAAGVQAAITKSYIDIPLAVRGLGDAAVDWTYNLPVSSTLMRRYLRIQGALRFSFNPFFQYLRVIPKTEILTESAGGGFLRSIFAGRSSQIGDIRTALREGKLFDEAGHLGNVQTGEAVEFGGFTGRNLNKRLLPMQERSIAGLVDAQAQRRGLDWQDYIRQYPHEVDDTIQSIAEYSRHANFINSPLARTLNIAFFPFRFDVKVAGYMAKGLSRTGPLTQVAVVNGLLKAHDFFNSPQGQAWYAQNSEVISVFKYITPLASLSEAMQSLLPGHDHSLGNFGELGGLPFGWIPMILDSEGLTQFNQPGVDPKTGQQIPSYVPATTKGAAAIAIQDLLGMLFSYPGASMGLPSKASLTRGAAMGLTGSQKGRDLVLDQPPTNTQPQAHTNYQSAPSGNMDVTPSSQQEDLTAQLRAKQAASKRLKKSDIRPIPAPGQSALGVL